MVPHRYKDHRFPQVRGLRGCMVCAYGWGICSDVARRVAVPKTPLPDCFHPIHAQPVLSPPSALEFFWGSL